MSPKIPYGNGISGSGIHDFGHFSGLGSKKKNLQDLKRTIKDNFFFLRKKWDFSDFWPPRLVLNLSHQILILQEMAKFLKKWLDTNANDVFLALIFHSVVRFQNSFFCFIPIYCDFFKGKTRSIRPVLRKLERNQRKKEWTQEFSWFCYLFKPA